MKMKERTCSEIQVHSKNERMNAHIGDLKTIQLQEKIGTVNSVGSIFSP